MIMLVPFLINIPAALNRSQFLFLLALTEAGVVPCRDRKKSTPTSSIVRIIFLFSSFEAIEGVLRNQNIMIDLEIFADQNLLNLA